MSDAARDAIAAREEAKRPRQNAVYGRVATYTKPEPVVRPPKAKPAPVVADVPDLVTVEDLVPVPVDDSPDIE
jgi:hypothetical protein